MHRAATRMPCPIRHTLCRHAVSGVPASKKGVSHVAECRGHQNLVCLVQHSPLDVFANLRPVPANIFFLLDPVRGYHHNHAAVKACVQACVKACVKACAACHHHTAAVCAVQSVSSPWWPKPLKPRGGYGSFACAAASAPGPLSPALRSSPQASGEMKFPGIDWTPRIDPAERRSGGAAAERPSRARLEKRENKASSLLGLPSLLLGALWGGVLWCHAEASASRFFDSPLRARWRHPPPRSARLLPSSRGSALWETPWQSSLLRCDCSGNSRSRHVYLV